MQKLIKGPVKGYKIVNNDMTCRDVKFDVGEIVTLNNNEPLELCKNGFHFCKYPSGPWAYYGDGRIFEVEAYEVLDAPVEPGADYKLVCRAIKLIKEIIPTGNRNVGNRNVGDRNTGHWNVGDRNVGDRNTGHGNVGDRNVGDRNTGHWNVGNRNVGDWNVGDRNTGHGNATDNDTGFFNTKERPLVFFDKPTRFKRSDIDFWHRINALGELLAKDEPFNYSDFLDLPNATVAKIKKLHQLHIAKRKKL